MEKIIDVKKIGNNFTAAIENAAGIGNTPLEAVRALLKESGPIKESALEVYFNN